MLYLDDGPAQGRYDSSYDSDVLTVRRDSRWHTYLRAGPNSSHYRHSAQCSCR